MLLDAMEPLSKRLGFHDEMAGLLLDIPVELNKLLAPPPGASVSDRPTGRYGFVLAFASEPVGLLWVTRMAFEHAKPMATVWLAHARAAVKVAIAFKSLEFHQLLNEHRWKKRSQIRIGKDQRNAEWIAIRLVHF